LREPFGIAALIVQQMGEGVRRRQIQPVRKLMLKADIQAVVHRRSMVVDKPDIAESRIGPVANGAQVSWLWRPGVEVRDRSVLVGSLDADMGDIEDIGPELLGDVRLKVCRYRSGRLPSAGFEATLAFAGLIDGATGFSIVDVGDCWEWCRW